MSDYDYDRVHGTAAENIGAPYGGQAGNAKQLPPPEPEMALAINEVQILGKVIEEARLALGDFTVRMVIGEQLPTDVERGERPRQSFNGGATGQLRREIETASEAAREVAQLASRLRRIG